MYKHNIKLNTGHTLVWESFQNIEAPAKLFNTLMNRTGSYTKTKQILRTEYEVFIFIK